MPYTLAKLSKSRIDMFPLGSQLILLKSGDMGSEVLLIPREEPSLLNTACLGKEVLRNMHPDIINTLEKPAL